MCLGEGLGEAVSVGQCKVTCWWSHLVASALSHAEHQRRRDPCALLLACMGVVAHCHRDQKRASGGGFFSSPLFGSMHGDRAGRPRTHFHPVNFKPLQALQDHRRGGSDYGSEGPAHFPATHSLCQLLPHGGKSQLKGHVRGRCCGKHIRDTALVSAGWEPGAGFRLSQRDVHQLGWHLGHGGAARRAPSLKAKPMLKTDTTHWVLNQARALTATGGAHHPDPEEAPLPRVRLGCNDGDRGEWKAGSRGAGAGLRLRDWVQSLAVAPASPMLLRRPILWASVSPPIELGMTTLPRAQRGAEEGCRVLSPGERSQE